MIDRIKKVKRSRLALVTTTLLIFVFFIFGSDRALTQSSHWETSPTNPNHIYNTNTGLVGIGTSTPQNKLHVKGENAYVTIERVLPVSLNFLNGAIQVGLSGGPFLAGAGPSVLFFADDSGQNKEFLGRVSGVWENPTNGAEAAGIAFNVRANSSDVNALTEAMRVTSAGNVGIGTTTPSTKLHVIGDATVTGNIAANGNVGIGTSTPSTKLHVVGDVTVTGNIAAKYQDVAEWVPARGQLAAGTVVSLDPSRTNFVTASSRSYDTRVAGVVSERPGLILGEAGEGKVMVATTGRVRVKVDATSGPIQVGDLLVTSDQIGVAMKSRPVRVSGTEIHRPGTIIGKALEPLARGRGEILVLLSMQ